MKKFLLSCAAVAMAMSAYADKTVYFTEDFEWFKPWVEAYDAANPKKPIGNTIGTNDIMVDAQGQPILDKNDKTQAANCPQFSTPKFEEVSLYDAAVAKGYAFPICHSAKDKSDKEVTARNPQAQIYVNACYLKFGLTNYYSGITFPALDMEGTVTNGQISFDWCPMRQGSGVFDETKLVVIVTNGEDEKQFLVDPLTIEKDAAFKWYPTTVSLAGATLTKGTKITIRNIDEQWPAEASKEAGNYVLRYFLDNIQIFSETGSGAAVEEINADENAPVEYYNLQGVRVANPENGLYIVKQGNKVAKRIIK